MPRQEEAGLLNTKSISSDFSTSTMKSEPGRPGRVPGATCTLWVANSACAAIVDGRVAAGLAASTAAAAFPLPVTDTAVAAPVIATPARNLRRLTSVGAFLRATTLPRIFVSTADRINGHYGNEQEADAMKASAPAPIGSLALMGPGQLTAGTILTSTTSWQPLRLSFP